MVLSGAEKHDWTPKKSLTPMTTGDEELPRTILGRLRAVWQCTTYCNSFPLWEAGMYFFILLILTRSTFHLYYRRSESASFAASGAVITVECPAM